MLVSIPKGRAQEGGNKSFQTDAFQTTSLTNYNSKIHITQRLNLAHAKEKSLILLYIVIITRIASGLVSSCPTVKPYQRHAHSQKRKANSSSVTIYSTEMLNPCNNMARCEDRDAELPDNISRGREIGKVICVEITTVRDARFTEHA